MITFLPFGNDHIRNARCLDKKRLLNQLTECKLILNGASTQWSQHPAVKMWEGYEQCLQNYANHILDECLKMGFNIYDPTPYTIPNKIFVPEWIDDKRLIISHRSNLARKNPVHYHQFKDYGVEGYWWPIPPKGRKPLAVHLWWEENIDRLHEL